MTDGTLELDPNLEQVLHDLTRDPRSRLFHVEPRCLLQGLLQGSLTVGTNRAGLLSAEAELLRTYRAELAALLRQAFLAAFFEGPDTLPNAPPSDLSTLPQVKCRLDGVRAFAPASFSSRRELDLLSGALTSPSRLDATGIHDFLVASLLLEDTHGARILLAKSYASRGQPRTALRTLEALLSGPIAPDLAQYADQTYGMVQSDLRNTRTSLAAYRRALSIARRDPSLYDEEIRCLLNVFRQLLDTEDTPSLLKIGRRIDGSVDLRSPVVDHQVRAFQLAFFDQRARTRAEDARSRLGPVCGRLLDAIH